ncbi:MAG: hypothetical protein ACQRW7_07325 [Caulobacterales bacterium]|uniref:hypothetical protein n=1 Tax=Glycocaulis sp. TaxID=1969725 RepID=UPI003F9F0B76
MRQNHTNTAIRPPPKNSEGKTELFDILAALLTSGDAPDADDMAAYLTALDSLDMDTAQKAELIHTLWQIVQTLVRIRFGLDPALDALSACANTDASAQSCMVQSSNKTRPDFSAAASGESDRP